MALYYKVRLPNKWKWHTLFKAMGEWEVDWRDVWRRPEGEKWTWAVLELERMWDRSWSGGPGAPSLGRLPQDIHRGKGKRADGSIMKEEGRWKERKGEREKRLCCAGWRICNINWNQRRGAMAHPKFRSVTIKVLKYCGYEQPLSHSLSNVHWWSKYINSEYCCHMHIEYLAFFTVRIK